jgi:hypothetical protein
MMKEGTMNMAMKRTLAAVVPGTSMAAIGAIAAEEDHYKEGEMKMGMMGGGMKGGGPMPDGEKSRQYLLEKRLDMMDMLMDMMMQSEEMMAKQKK